jgi:hypothetical protein
MTKEGLLRYTSVTKNKPIIFQIEHSDTFATQKLVLLLRYFYLYRPERFRTLVVKAKQREAITRGGLIRLLLLNADLVSAAYSKCYLLLRLGNWILVSMVLLLVVTSIERAWLV